MKNIFIILIIVITAEALDIFCAEKSTSPLLQRRSTQLLKSLSINTKNDSKELPGNMETKDLISIRFTEFGQPSTPGLEKIELYGLSLYFEQRQDFSVSIIFEPRGGSYTPKKTYVDLGDKSGDDTYDKLKINLPRDPETSLKMLTAILAKKTRNYLATKKQGNLNHSTQLEDIAALAKHHKQDRIAHIITNVNNHNKYNETIYQKYEVELCTLQKSAEEALVKAGLVLLK